MENGALDNAEAIAWICFVLGTVVLLAGLYAGLKTAHDRTEEENRRKLDEAKAKLEQTTSHLKAATQRGVEGAAAADAAAIAGAAAEEAKSALEQVGGMVGSLPEHQRLPGMLVLVGAVLMSVGTIQFGGTSIF